MKQKISLAVALVLIAACAEPVSAPAPMQENVTDTPALVKVRPGDTSSFNHHVADLDGKAKTKTAKVNGALKQSATGSSSPSETAPQAAYSNAQKPVLSEAELTKFGKSLDLIAKRSKRGEKAVEVRRLLLKAMAAPTWEEYQRIMRPFHAGRGTPSRSNTVDAVDATNTIATESGRRSSGPSADVEVATEECTTEMFGVTYVDVCTTDADVDPAWAELDAMEAELNADNAESLARCASMAPDPNSCYGGQTNDESSFGTADWSGQESLRASTLMEFDGVVDAPDCGSDSTELSNSLLPQANDDCIGSAVMASIGLLLWISEKGTFKGAGRKIAKTALTNAHARLILGAFGSGYAIGMAFNCFWEQW